MTATIIDGKRIAGHIKKAIRRDIKNIRAKDKRVLRLVALQIGRNHSSEVYLKAQMRLASELGIKYRVKTLKASVSRKTAENEITKLNNDNSVSGIIIHTPTPRHIDAESLFAKIRQDKDVEGLSPANMGKLAYRKAAVVPCTASACMALIDATGTNLRGKEAVIVGYSEIVGKPLSLILLSRLATVTVCHIGTYEKGLLKKHVRRAEILVVSVGKRYLIKGSWIRKGSIVIDVGINKYKGVITGDVDFNSARKRASYITPVPGGVGPLTAIMLMKNLVALYKDRK